jgi:hypothetical protein
MSNEKHQTIKKFDSAAFAFAGGVGPWIAPIAPALVFGSAFATSMWDKLGWIAVVGGAVAGIGLITAGAFTSHNAIERGGLWWLAAISCVSLEIGGLWAMDIDLNMRVVGTVLALITFLVYISRAGAAQISEVKAERNAERQDAREFQKQMELEKMRLDHARTLELDKLQTQATIAAEQERTKATGLQAQATAEAERVRLERERLAFEAEQKRIEAERKQRIADEQRRESERRAALEQRQAEQARIEAEAALIKCGDCERVFDTQQALNAHKRFCDGIKADEEAARANGKAH